MLPKLAIFAIAVFLALFLVVRELDALSAPPCRSICAVSAASGAAAARGSHPLPGAAAAASPIAASGAAAASASTATTAGCATAEQPRLPPPPPPPPPPPLVLVHVGASEAHFPSYIAETVRQALRWNPHLHVHLVLPASFVASDAGAGLRRMLRSGFTEDVAFWGARVTVTDTEALTPAMAADGARLAAFRASAPALDAEYAGGFWRYSAERLFFLDAALEHLRIDEAFHMENDNALFARLQDLLPALRSSFRGLAATALSADTFTAGFLYIRRRAALAQLLDHIIANPGATNEMAMLSAFAAAQPAALGMLPSAPAAAALAGTPDALLPRIVGDAGAFAALGGYFDCAAYGQWLGGPDAIHSGGVVTPHHENGVALFSARKLAFKWAVDAVSQLRRPYLAVANATNVDGNAHAAQPEEWWPIFTVHVHSKEVALVAS